jgi:RNA polymerase sigma-70 factor, ECF subfamily
MPGHGNKEGRAFMRVRTSSPLAPVGPAAWTPGDRVAEGNPPELTQEFTQEFTRVFDANATFVWRVLRRLGVPDADADDAVQDVFLVVHRRLHEYEERGSIRAWLFAICRQVASHRRRTTQRRERTKASLPVPPSPVDPQEEAMRLEAVAIVHRFLATIDEAQGIVFYLADVEGMTAPEIASALEANLNTVYGRLRIARQRFEAFVAALENREAETP